MNEEIFEQLIEASTVKIESIQEYLKNWNRPYVPLEKEKEISYLKGSREAFKAVLKTLKQKRRTK